MVSPVGKKSHAKRRKAFEKQRHSRAQYQKPVNFNKSAKLQPLREEEKSHSSLSKKLLWGVAGRKQARRGAVHLMGRYRPCGGDEEIGTAPESLIIIVVETQS